MTTTSQPPFAIEIEVRNYELDTQGHVNSAVYLQYAEHARWRHLASLGITQSELGRKRIGPVFLELTIKYHCELRAGDTVTVTSELVFDEAGNRTFLVLQRLSKADGTVAAELRSVAGLLDLETRRLVPDPRQTIAELMTA
jgi:acyl-CoA thioester hydrolase